MNKILFKAHSKGNNFRGEGKGYMGGGVILEKIDPW